ncbi:transporter substrate-binding domain-containing protein [Defluviimonas sp. D31]|uniref:transporter substrate-binding domain-containing protein n=1 Tax=Defluviimonas sp. D31 TaxID=3083253 RepID=UPI00296EFA78|nr:transporter substrate-binding domain-containing protein [Defluviimonas sp. D31]
MDRGYMLLMGEPAWPPFSFKDENGNYAGFDVEVADEVTKRLGVEPRRIERALSWEQETGGNWNGVIDVSIGSMTPTAKRGENLIFPAVYSYQPASVAVHRDNTTINVPAEASGRRIAVLRTSIYDVYLQRVPMDIKNAPPVNYAIDDPVVVYYEVEGEPLAALKKGDGVEVDATINALVALMDEVQKGEPIRILGQPIFYTPGAIAIEKGDPELADKLASIVADMRSDGSLTRISKKWFGLDLTAVP